MPKPEVNQVGSQSLDGKSVLAKNSTITAIPTASAESPKSLTTRIANKIREVKENPGEFFGNAVRKLLGLPPKNTRSQLSERVSSLLKHGVNECKDETLLKSVTGELDNVIKKAEAKNYGDIVKQANDGRVQVEGKLERIKKDPLLGKVRNLQIKAEKYVKSKNSNELNSIINELGNVIEEAKKEYGEDSRIAKQVGEVKFQTEESLKLIKSEKTLRDQASQYSEAGDIDRLISTQQELQKVKGRLNGRPSTLPPSNKTGTVSASSVNSTNEVSKKDHEQLSKKLKELETGAKECVDTLRSRAQLEAIKWELGNVIEEAEAKNYGNIAEQAKEVRAQVEKWSEDMGNAPLTIDNFYD